MRVRVVCRAIRLHSRSWFEAFTREAHTHQRERLGRSRWNSRECVCQKHPGSTAYHAVPATRDDISQQKRTTLAQMSAARPTYYASPPASNPHRTCSASSASPPPVAAHTPSGTTVARCLSEAGRGAEPVRPDGSVVSEAASVAVVVLDSRSVELRLLLPSAATKLLLELDCSLRRLLLKPSAAWR